MSRRYVAVLSRTLPLGALLIAAMACLADTAAVTGELTVEVSGVTPNRGQVYVALYDRADTFPISGRQRERQVLPPEAGHLSVHFRDLPPGQYAVAAFQDSNGNGVLDKNFLGIPEEPYGFSNGARASAGPPRFAQAAVTLPPNRSTTIVLK